jgi:hypothetical protein
MIADAAIVGDVRLRHEQAVGTDLSEVVTSFSAAMQRSELSKGIALPAPKHASFASILQIGRHAACRHEGKEDCAAPELRGTLDYAMTGHLNSVMKSDVVANYRVWANRHVSTEISLRADNSCIMDGHVQGDLLLTFQPA